MITSKKVKGESRQCCKPLVGDYFCKKHEKNGKLGFKYDFLDFINVRNHVLINDDQLDDTNKWMKEVPYDTRQLAIKPLIAAYKGGFTAIRNGHIESFDIKYKSKRQQLKYFI
jgi:hypothetical protein